jgi:hypothetical protein
MFVLVTGPPAAGKTSLAVPLARALGLPLLSKDAIKEALFDELPSPGPDERNWSRSLSDASYRALLNLAEHVPAAVLDLNLPPEWAEQFEGLAVPLAQVFCRCERSELERRLVERATTRHPAHRDDILLDEVRAQGVRGIDPAALQAPLLEVDTTTAPDVEAVAAWARARLGLQKA